MREGSNIFAAAILEMGPHNLSKFSANSFCMPLVCPLVDDKPHSSEFERKGARPPKSGRQGWEQLQNCGSSR